MNDNNCKWVTAWGNAISIAERRPENYAKNLTLRYPIKMMLDADEIRITLDNFCGTEPVTITCVEIARSDGTDKIDTETISVVTFSGKQSVEIQAGERIKSDSIKFSVKKDEFIAVSIYFADFTEMRSGVVITGPLSKGYFAVGNQMSSEVLDINTSKKTNTIYFLSDVEVLTSQENRTVICFGDSITAQAWPDYLIQRTLETGNGRTAVIRKAASGTRILRQSLISVIIAAIAVLNFMPSISSETFLIVLWSFDFSSSRYVSPSISISCNAQTLSANLLQPLILD